MLVGQVGWERRGKGGTQTKFARCRQYKALFDTHGWTYADINGNLIVDADAEYLVTVRYVHNVEITKKVVYEQIHRSF
jgi:hypothetical protein